MKKEMVDKFRNRQAVIGIVGLGYVGLPLMLRFGAVGFRTLGIDIDCRKIEKLNAGESYIAHIPSEQIAAARDAGLEATSDFSRAAEADALIICVPTPLNKNREPDLSFVTGTVDALAPHLRPGQVLSPSTPLSEKILSTADCVLVATDHDSYDYDFILEHANLIVDTRNVFPDRKAWGHKIYPA